VINHKKLFRLYREEKFAVRRRGGRLASSLNPPTISMGEDVAFEMARDYHSGDAKAKKVEAMELRLAQYGIIAEQIRAKAIQFSVAAVS
jgi:hypothetical protein